MQKISGHFIAGDDAVSVECGFIPDRVELYSALGGTELGFVFLKILADLETSGRYGIALANAGTISVPTTAATGIIPYNGEKTPRVRIPAANGNGYSNAEIYGNYDATADYSSVGTDRSTSVVGTIIRPTTHNGCVYELKTGVATASDEPTWETTPGEETTDTGLNVWICREEDLVNIGSLGFTVGVDICTDGEIWVFTAEKHDEVKDRGDADSADPI